MSREASGSSCRMTTRSVMYFICQLGPRESCTLLSNFLLTPKCRAASLPLSATGLAYSRRSPIALTYLFVLLLRNFSFMASAIFICRHAPLLTQASLCRLKAGNAAHTCNHFVTFRRSSVIGAQRLVRSLTSCNRCVMLPTTMYAHVPYARELDTIAEMPFLHNAFRQQQHSGSLHISSDASRVSKVQKH